MHMVPVGEGLARPLGIGDHTLSKKTNVTKIVLGRGPNLDPGSCNKLTNFTN
jgi:hypothetical protein